MHIRPANRPDMDRVADIIRSSADWYEPLVEDDDMDQHDVDSDWAEENYQERDFYVAQRQQEIIGTVTLQDAGDWAYLGYVYLHADHTGRGLGKRLLRFARDEARRRGKRGMVLIAHPDAEWAIRAYEKFGFEILAEDRDEVLAWNDGWLEPFYEEGFCLMQYRFEAETGVPVLAA